MMFFRRGFTLVEILIAIVLMGLIVLAVTSVDIASRRFFGTASDESRIQDEAKIAMAHIVKNVQNGIGDMTNPSTSAGNSPSSDDTRGFLILNDSGVLIDLSDSTDLGTQIQVKQDTDGSGKFDANDKTIRYRYQKDATNKIYRIVFDPDISAGGDEEYLADGIVEKAIFDFDDATPNQVGVTITVRKNPAVPASLDNPETTLTSSIILRAMSTN